MMATTAFSMVFTNQIRMKVLMVLNNVCNMDRPYNTDVPSSDVGLLTTKPSVVGFGRPKSSIIIPTSPKKGLNRMSAHITPKRLNMVCDMAARFAWVLPTEAAILAVMVVPMFSPNTIAQAILNGIQPMLSIMSVMAIVADEDWSTRVRMVPKARKMSTDAKPWLDHVFTKSSTSGVSFKSGTDSFIKERPRNKRQKPTMSSPMF